MSEGRSTAIARRAALVVMAVMTAWSVWAWAQPRKALPPQLPPPKAAPVQIPPQKAPPARAVEAPPAAGKEAEAETEEPKAFNFTEFGEETPPFLAMLINFGIFAAGFYLFGRKPIAASLENRRQSIARDIEEATRMRLEAEARAKTYQAKLERLEVEVAAAREALVRAGEAERDRIVREAEATAERMRKDAEFLVEQELKQIRVDLLRETVDAAVLAAEELLKKRVTEADQERLAEDYLADLGGKPAGAAQTSRPGPGSGA